MKDILNSVIDKFLRLILFFDFSYKKSDNYIYQRDFLGKDDYWKDIEQIFKPITETVGNDFEKIYRIKESVYSEQILSKIKYYIENKMWGLFALTLSDGYQMSNEEYFKHPSLRVYLIVKRNKEKTIVVIKSKVKHFEVMASYPKINVWLSNFRDKKIVYSIENNFTSL